MTEGNSWWSTGFNALPPASEKQKQFILHLRGFVTPLVDSEEKVVIRLMGFEEWVSSLSKARVQHLITAAKLSKTSAGRAAKAKCSAHPVCPECQTRTRPKENGFRCPNCGYFIFSVDMV